MEIAFTIIALVLSYFGFREIWKNHCQAKAKKRLEKNQYSGEPWREAQDTVQLMDDDLANTIRDTVRLVKETVMTKHGFSHDDAELFALDPEFGQEMDNVMRTSKDSDEYLNNALALIQVRVETFPERKSLILEYLSDVGHPLGQ